MASVWRRSGVFGLAAVAVGALLVAVREHRRLVALASASIQGARPRAPEAPTNGLPLPEHARRLRETQAALGLPIV